MNWRNDKDWVLKWPFGADSLNDVLLSQHYQKFKSPVRVRVRTGSQWRWRSNNHNATIDNWQINMHLEYALARVIELHSKLPK